MKSRFFQIRKTNPCTKRLRGVAQFKDPQKNKLIAIVLFPFLLLSCIWDDEYKTRQKPPPPSPIEILAKSLSLGGFRLRGKRVIVLTFYDRDETRLEPRFGELISEKLTTELVKIGDFQILDRGIYGKILQNKGLSLDGNVDMATLKKIAEALQVDGVITGILYKYRDGIFVNTRLLDIDSGVILKAEEVFVVVQ
jgi:TolB-like protein